MTPQHARKIRGTRTAAEMGALLGTTGRQVYRYEAGEPMSESVAKLYRIAERCPGCLKEGMGDE